MFHCLVYDLIIVHNNLRTLDPEINLNLSILSLPCVFIVDCVLQNNSEKMERAGRSDRESFLL